MPKLTTAIKLEIVQRLACYESPSEVQAQVQELYGVVVPIPQVVRYNPDTIGSELGQKWRALFEETRRRFNRHLSNIAVARRTFRLKELQRMYLEADRRNHIRLAAALLEQAAKECGRFYERLPMNGGIPRSTVSPAAIEIRVRRESAAEYEARNRRGAKQPRRRW